MEDVKKRAANSDAKTGSPKKQRVSKKATKARSKKDPNAPKKPMTAYLYFLQEYRGKLKSDLPATSPKLKIGDVAREGGKKWQSMSDEQKKPYQVMYEKAKLEYNKQMQKLKPSTVNGDPDAPIKPKKPMSSFFHYLADCRCDNEKKGCPIDKKNILAIAGERWKNMSDEEKKPYCDKAKKANEEYKVNMKEYNAKVGLAAGKGTKQKKEKPKVQAKESSDSDEEEEVEEDENDDDEEEEEEEEEEEDESD